MVSKIEVRADSSTIRIYINSLLHLSIKKSPIISIQSWIDGHSIYWIEYQTENTSILCEYWDRQIWEDILKQIDEKELF